MDFGWDRADPLFSKLRWPDNFLSTKWHENGKKWSETHYKDGNEVSRKEF